jgi:serine/threonine-protein kinase RsbT
MMAPSNDPSFPDQVVHLLGSHVGVLRAREALDGAYRKLGRSRAVALDERDRKMVVELVCAAMATALPDVRRRESCRAQLRDLARGASVVARPSGPVEMRIRVEDDIVVARQRAGEQAEAAGFNHTERIKIITVVSEVARNMYKYAGGGKVTVTVLPGARRGLQVEAVDEGPGIPNLEEILSNRYHSKTGMGLGILSCKRLMDECTITTAAQKGTTVSMRKYA